MTLSDTAATGLPDDKKALNKFLIPRADRKIGQTAETVADSYCLSSLSLITVSLALHSHAVLAVLLSSMLLPSA